MPAFDQFFRFPVRIYDMVSSLKLMAQDDKNWENPDEISREEPDWVKGYMTVNLNQIIGWHEVNPIEITPEETARDGFKLTYVKTFDYGGQYCLWDEKTFSKRFSDALDKLEKYITDKKQQQPIKPSSDESPRSY